MNFQISKWPYPQEIRAEFLSAYFFGSRLRVTRLMLVICDMWHGTSHKIVAPTCADNFKFINSAFTSKCYTLTLKCSRLMVSRPYLNKDTWHHTISDEHDFWHNSSWRFLTELTNLHLRPNNHGNNNNNNYVLSHFSKSEAPDQGGNPLSPLPIRLAILALLSLWQRNSNHVSFSVSLCISKSLPRI